MRVPYIIAAIAVLFVLLDSFYVVDQRNQALVLRLGNVNRVITEPGLHFKIPQMENVVQYDKRILNLDVDVKELLTQDQKRVLIDSFAKFRIVDPLKFYQTVRDENGIRARLNPILDSSVRQVIGSVLFSDLLTDKRVQIMEDIQQVLNREAQGFGVEMIDVRLTRTDLPPDNSEWIFKRIRTEREREAKESRSIGAEEAIGIRSRAERERTEILAEAEQRATIIRGQAEGEAIKIFSEAFNRDPEFYAFYRSMQAYRKTLKSEDTKLILSPNSEFLRYMNNLNGR